MRLRISLVAAVVLLAAVLTVRPAQAAPILGGQLTYTGGTVTVVSQVVTSGFVSELGLYDSAFTRLLYLMDDEPAGVSVTFDPSASGIAVGAELIFGIRITIPATLDEYFMGPAARNPDGVMHATVDNLGGGEFMVGFEDLSQAQGSDNDYDDNKFLFTGGVSVVPQNVPEPGILGLLAIGFGSLVRRRFSSSTR